VTCVLALSSRCLLSAHNVARLLRRQPPRTASNACAAHSLPGLCRQQDRGTSRACTSLTEVPVATRPPRLLYCCTLLLLLLPPRGCRMSQLVGCCWLWLQPVSAASCGARIVQMLSGRDGSGAGGQLRAQVVDQRGVGRRVGDGVDRRIQRRLHRAPHRGVLHPA
jgi:hypothetical protein